MAKNSFPPLLHLTYILQQVSDEVLLEEAGIGLSQVRLMSVLDLTKPRSQREVARALSQTEANVSRQLRQMDKDGLVSIKRNKKDSRQREVLLSAKGAKKYQESEKILKRQQASFLKMLKTSELNAFENAAQLLSAGHNL
jgi:DNA-binding MarR family transcriptional regulator